MTQKELDLEVARRLEDFANKLPNLNLSSTDIFNIEAALTYAITTLRMRGEETENERLQNCC